MKLMAIPRVMPPHAHFREPLRHHKEIPLVAGALHHFRKLVVKCDFENDVRAWRDRLCELHLENRVVVRIAVVRLNELDALREVALPCYLERFHFAGAVVLGVPA